jgi:hypothetical protein
VIYSSGGVALHAELYKGETAFVATAIVLVKGLCQLRSKETDTTCHREQWGMLEKFEMDEYNVGSF